jgi:streptogramin lyase
MVAGGSYAVSAERVAAPDPIVRRAFVPKVGSSPVCVRDGQTSTVRVDYGPIASSHKVWMGNRGPLLGFASATVAATGTVSATVAATVATGQASLAFDKDGNLWATSGEPPILRISAGSLGSSGPKTADIEIRSAAFDGGVPHATKLALDKEGNLWTNVLWAKKVIKFNAAHIRASGNIAPSVEITGLTAPTGIAFDATGNLWVCDEGEARVVRYNAARLSASISASAAPDLVLVGKTHPPVIGELAHPLSLAFDSSGNLWVDYAGTIVKWPASDLSGSGRKELTPAVQMSLHVLVLTEGLAFDESGGMWIAASQGKFFRLSADQLTSAGQKTPSTIITSPDVDYALDFAIFPAPAGLPLYHSWP